ncbi:MAG TPA: SMP-30/gluconolactonase/LRE family protein [Puia sp.]|nr:SMP-30/gluconolactonase/LRE family protein [Puia sp.]
MKASVLYSSRCELGEGPYWHAQRKSCFWVDIEARKIFEYKWLTGVTTVKILPSRVSLVVQDSNDQLILALEGGIAKYDFDTDALDCILDLERELLDHRPNDGKVDPKGRLWLGTMHREFNHGAGSLYSIQGNLECRRKLTGITISNGLAWSPDSKRLYYIDSPTQKVQCFRFDAATGQIDFQDDVIHIPTEMGTPDGMAIDADGLLWIAHWGGFGVYRWDTRNGRCVGKIELPVPNVTSCAFGGPDLDHLLITTARQDLSADDLARYPTSGDLYIAKMPVKGTLPNKCLL